MVVWAQGLGRSGWIMCSPLIHFYPSCWVSASHSALAWQALCANPRMALPGLQASNFDVKVNLDFSSYLAAELEEQPLRCTQSTHWTAF